MNDVEKKLKTMGLILKAPKCRSLSIKGGTACNIPFTLDNSGSPVQVLSVLDRHMKFLGSEMTGNTTESAMFVTIKTKLETKLENIKRSSLRG